MSRFFIVLQTTFEVSVDTFPNPHDLKADPLFDTSPEDAGAATIPMPEHSRRDIRTFRPADVMTGVRQRFFEMNQIYRSEYPHTEGVERRIDFFNIIMSCLI